MLLESNRHSSIPLRGDAHAQSRHSRFGVVAAEPGERQHAFALQPVRPDTQRALREYITLSFF